MLELWSTVGRNMTKDTVSEELRAVERQIDISYRSNLLTSIPRPQAVWCLLAACEELFVRQLVPSATPPTAHEERALADSVINLLKWPLRWLTQACPEGDKLRETYDPNLYEAAWALTELADDYLSFESAFSYASWGLITLRLEDHRIMSSGVLRGDSRWDAYDRLVDATTKDQREFDLNELREIVAPTVQVHGERFKYGLNPGIVKRACACADSALSARFTLPAEWQLTTYTLGQYRIVMRMLWVLSALHFTARIVAIVNGCVGLGYSRALMVMERPELLARLARYTGLPRETVSGIVTDITYGAHGIRSPDPALQPLIELVPGTLVWAPNIVINSALERNLLVLLNRFPEGRRAYSRISGLREGLLRDSIRKLLRGLGLRFWFGNIAGWGDSSDIDLAIMSDKKCCCLILELKSFTAPAEPREIREKSEEIANGIDQIRIRRDLAVAQPDPLLRALGVTSDYSLYWAVASETSVGGVWVQADDVPVVRASHLVARLTRNPDLSQICAWLESKDYLPVPTRDYSEVSVDVSVGDWTLAWFGIKGLAEGYM
jgi:hypothetical protein